jgi:hypothetical protein
MLCYPGDVYLTTASDMSIPRSMANSTQVEHRPEMPCYQNLIHRTTSVVSLKADYLDIRFSSIPEFLGQFIVVGRSWNRSLLRDFTIYMCSLLL